MLKKIRQIFSSNPPVGAVSDDDGLAGYLTREKLVVFGISFILAFCLWFIVNLSRDFNITINLPIELGNLPENQALVGDIPEYVSVGVTGEGWKLISLYNNPPGVIVDVTGSEVNLFEKVQQQLGTLSDINVVNVQPIMLPVEFEEKVSKKVPVDVRVDITLRERFGIISDPVVSPDSVTVTGASSKIAGVDSVSTREVVMSDVNSNYEIDLTLESPGNSVSVEPGVINYRIDVAEFTEGEVRVPIRIRNIPAGRAVSYYPSSVSVRYDVPVDQYIYVQNITPFQAFIDFETIEEDTTGLVIPQIERLTGEYIVRLRSFQPRTVSYFNVVDED